MAGNRFLFAQEEIFRVENVLSKLVIMIPNDKENQEILSELQEAENIVTNGIKNKNLRGASASNAYLQPCFSVMYDHNYGIKNLCKKFGLATK
jgi:hypothetical protein